jgi:V/A-type H+/Na+-transporting ATPase subunit D
MKLKINPTRQELLKIKKRLKTAQSGHGLLKEKLEGLMQEFLANIKNLKLTREELEKNLPQAFFNFFCFNNRIGYKETEKLINHFPLADVDLSFSNIMGVKVRKIELKNSQSIKQTKFSRFSNDNFVDQAKRLITENMDNLLVYANLMIKIRLLAEEIEKTRRRVNSLEYVYIPEMLRIKKYISQKLEERERFDRTVILKLKEIMEAK